MKNLVNIGHLPPRLGGSAMVNEELVRGLSEAHDWNIRLISHGLERFKGMLTPTLLGTSIPIEWFVMDYFPAHEDAPAEYTQKKNEMILNSLHKVMSTFPADAIMVGHECYAWSIPELKQLGLPIALVTHGTPTHGLGQGIYSNESRDELLRCMGESDIVIAVSQYLADILNGFGIENVHVINNAIDIDMFSPRPPNQKLRAELDLAPEDFVVSHYSNMRPIKRVQDLVEAAKLVRNENFKYLIVGDGPCREGIVDMVKADGLQSKFKFLGKLPRKRIPELMNLSDIVVSTSEREGFGRSIREAQACGKVVIASRSGPALIQHGYDGLVYDVGNVDELAGYILGVANNKFEAIGKNAVCTAKSYDLAAQVKEYSDVLNDLCLIHA